MTGEVPRNNAGQGPIYPFQEGAEEATERNHSNPEYTSLAFKAAVGTLAVAIPVAGLEVLQIANQWATHGAGVEPLPFVIDLEILFASGLGIGMLSKFIRNTRRGPE